MLLGIAGLQAAAWAETILFVGNNFTFGGGSPPVLGCRPDSVAWNRAIAESTAAHNPYLGLGPDQINLWAADEYVDAKPSGNWNLVVAASDEFDGFTLDAAKWKKGLWYDTSGVLAFKQENIAVSGGNLVLTARREAFNEKSYTYGAVESLFDVPGVKGYVEVRAKALHHDANVLSAIWLQSSPLTAHNNPNPEVDIQETFNYYAVVSTLHTWTIDPDKPAPTAEDEYIHTRTAPNEFNTGVNVGANYHIYGLERSNGRLRFYFDGRLAWEIAPSEPSFVNMPRHVVLSLEGHLGDPVDRYLPQSFLVDYVRTYIPAAD